MSILGLGEATLQLAQQPTDNHNNIVGHGDYVVGSEAVGLPAPAPTAENNEEGQSPPWTAAAKKQMTLWSHEQLTHFKQ